MSVPRDFSKLKLSQNPFPSAALGDIPRMFIPLLLTVAHGGNEKFDSVVTVEEQCVLESPSKNIRRVNKN